MPCFLVLGKLVLQELGDLVTDVVGNLVLRKVAAQKTKLVGFVFPERSQTSNQIAHRAD